MFKKIVILLLFIVSCFYFLPRLVKADDQSDLEKKAAEYSQKLTELGSAKNTLSNQIKLLDSQYQLTLVKITQTENSIKTLESEIASLNVEIGKLEIQINQLSIAYIHQTVQNYKLEKRIPAFAFLFSANLNTYLEQQRYVTSVQKNSQNNLIDMETIRTNYDIQKQAKAKKQADLEVLQTTLASQKNSLSNQKDTKNSLLQITKNDEKKYQQLLMEVQSKLASFNNSSAGCLSSAAGGGSDGNYYSQIDPRWCKQYIGLQTKYTIGGAGCYLTSMSMVLKKIGININPSVYAADPSRFTSTADLIEPTPPSGYTYKKIIGNNASIIDNELKSDRYVIVEVPMPGSPSGSHFIVLISGSNGNYKMHDPWRGADLNFSSYYSVSRIKSLRLFTK
jgi:peptidoglycan hydrolase CwlO-like protein